MARVSNVLQAQQCGHRLVLENDSGVSVALAKGDAKKRFQLLYFQAGAYPHSGVLVSTVSIRLIREGFLIC